MSSNDIIYQSKGALISFLVSEGFQTGSDTGNITGSALENEIAVWSNPTTIEGDANFTWDNTLRVTGAFFVSGDTTLGDASGDSVTINAQTIDLANVAAGTDNTVLIFNGSSVVTDEIDPKVWAGDLVDYTGTPADNQVAIFTDVDTVEGDSNLTWNGSTLDVGGALTVDGNTTLGDASGDSVTINAQTIALSNVDTGTDNTVLVYDGESIVTDEIDSKVWAGKLIDYTGTPVDSQLGVWTDTDTLEGDANLTFDGTLRVTGSFLASGNTTLGDASGDSVTINAQTIDLANVAAGTDNTVLVYNGSSIVTDEIDSKVWAGDLVDYTGTPVNNQVAIWTDTDTLEGDSDLTFDGTALTMLTSSATIAQTRLIEYTNGTDAMTVLSDGTIGLARGNVGSPSVQTVDHESDGYDEWTKIMSHGALSNYWAPNVVALVTLNPMGFASAAPGQHFEFIVTARWSRSATGAGAYVAHTDITVEAVNSAAIGGWNPTTDIILTYDGITSAEIWIKGKSNYASCDVTILGGSPLAQPVGSFNPPGWQIEPYQNSTWTTFSSLGTDVYGTWVSKALTGLVVTGSVVAPNIGADTDDTVIILNSSGYLKTDEIDSRVWGSTLLDGTNGTDNEIAIFTDSNSVEGDASLTWNGTVFAATSGSLSNITLSSNDAIIGTHSNRTAIINTNGGYIEAKSGHATYGLIVRDYNSDGWANITTNNGLLQLSYNNNSTTTGIFLNDTDNVGIGDSSPSYRLDVNGTLRSTGNMYANGELEITSDLNALGDTFLDGAIILGGQSSLGTGMRAEFRNTGGQTYSSYNGVYWESCIAHNTYARTVLTTESTEDYDVVGPGIYSSNIYWFWKYTSATTTYRVITAGSSFTFTGQHLTVPMDSDISSSLSDYVGLIAVSSGNQMRWDEIKEEWVTGSEAVTINETLPRIELATSRADKRVFGVISNRPDNYVVNSETNEIEEDQDGTAYSWNDLKQTQIRINSLGEGAIWVCNINGNLENGDYITSCEVPGLGMKQDDDLLHNYTVAKITQDCNFRINSTNYNVVEFEFSGSTYRKAFVGCTYHCG